MSDSQNRANPANVRIIDGATRAFDMTIDIAADPEAVWKALTEAAELVRWFPLEASVEPRKGGTMLWSWEEMWDWKHRINAWEPNRLLRLVDDRYVPFDVHGKPMAEGRVRPAPVAIEITLEAGGSGTTLRLVHSGFEHGKDWDDEFEGISTGWQSELRFLKYYLERYRGRDRTVGMARQTTNESNGAAWRRVMSDGYGMEAATVVEGASYAAHTPAGTRLTGTILTALPDREFTGSVGDLDGAFRVGAHRAGGETGVMLWFSSYRPEDASRVSALREEAQTMLDRLFERSRTTP
jgi:uncharacterized protein YndB with AHSA1/START domain